MGRVMFKEGPKKPLNVLSKHQILVVNRHDQLPKRYGSYGRKFMRSYPRSSYFLPVIQSYFHFYMEHLSARERN